VASLDSSSATGGVLELPGDDYFIYGRGASQRCELRVPVHEHAPGLCQQVADEHKVKARNATLRLSPVFAVCCVSLFWGGGARAICVRCTLNCPSVCESIHVFDACVSIPAAISKPQDSRLTTLHRRVKTRNKRAGRARAHVHTKARRARAPGRAGREKKRPLCVPCVCVCRANYMILTFTVCGTDVVYHTQHAGLHAETKRLDRPGRHPARPSAAVEMK
jgi:hypothetical protein